MFILALLCFHLIGLPFLSFGLVRARQIPIWLAVAATAGTICAFFGSGTKVESVGWVVSGIALAAIGATIVNPALLTRATARVAHSA